MLLNPIEHLRLNAVKTLLNDPPTYPPTKNADVLIKIDGSLAIVIPKLYKLESKVFCDHLVTLRVRLAAELNKLANAERLLEFGIRLATFCARLNWDRYLSLDRSYPSFFKQSFFKILYFLYSMKSPSMTITAALKLSVFVSKSNKINNPNQLKVNWLLTRNMDDFFNP